MTRPGDYTRQTEYDHITRKNSHFHAVATYEAFHSKERSVRGGSRADRTLSDPLAHQQLVEV
jgi:hypothetical protein